MSEQKLYLFVGYPGSGKTTIAKLIKAKTGAEHIWADHERHHMFNTVTHSRQESTQLYAELNQQTSDLLGQGKSVLFDTNFNFYKDREHLRQIARQHGTEAVVIWVTTPLELAKKRAVEESNDQETRIWGNMPAERFDRIARNLEPPRQDEKVIKIDGTNIDEAAVLAQLGL